MRRQPTLPVLILSVVAALAVAGCASGGAPSWTYAPAPSASAAASGAASGAPSGGASVAPSSVASVSPSGAPSLAPSTPPASVAPSGGGATLTVTATAGAATAGFQPKTLETAAGTAFTLTFDNQDDTVPHNLVLQNADGSAVAVQGDTKIFTGPGERPYQVPALTAGAYKYICQVHPTTMIGTLTVK